jgi:2-polyprenyl-3-methyl-5-hydroxy-6-metoxy-1,4-benzoquinol methylase
MRTTLVIDSESSLATKTVSRLVSRPAPQRAEFSLFLGNQPNADDVSALSAGLDPACVGRIDADRLIGLDIELVDALPVFPQASLEARWRSALLCEEPIRNPSSVVARDVLAARSAGSSNVAIVDPTCSEHEEAMDFSVPANVDKGFFYMDDPLHRRRVRMLADVVASRVRRIVEEKGSAHVLELGVGLSVVSRFAIERLDERIRPHVRFSAVDVSEDLLRYGIHMGWLDDGIVADVSKTPSDQLEQILGRPDVFIAAEVLEHIRSSASVFARTLLPWLRESGSYFVGSVPNAVQGMEMLPLATADFAPHQLTRPMFDETLDHVAFYSYPTLRQALTETWQMTDIAVWGNGLRLDRRGETLCFDAALRFPHRSDRLCFAGLLG